MGGLARGARVVRAAARPDRRGVSHERARRVRRRAHEGGVPVGRRRRVRAAVHAHVRRRRQRRVHRDPGVLHGRERDGRRRARGRRGEDVLDAAASAGRVPHDLRQHPRTSARAEPALDLRARDEPLHDGARHRQARHRRGRGEEQAERGRPPGGAARTGRHHDRGRARLRDARVAGATTGRLADQRRRRRDRRGERGGRQADHERPRLDPGRRVEPRHRVLDQPRPRVPRVRRERRPHGVRDGRRDRAPQADPRRRALRPVRLQGAAPPRGTPAVRQGQGARGRPGRRPRPEGRPALVSRAAACSASATRSRRPD